MLKIKHLGLIASLAVVTACSSSIDPETGQRADPLEGFNRAMWSVNYNVLDPYVFKPVATGWKEYVPSPIKTGLTNVASNLSEPMSFVSRLLEGEGQKAMVHFNRFWINSTFGLGGLIDWASQTPDLKLENGHRSLGDTLGAYGVPTGAYIMLPALGPTTPRGLVGTAGNWAANQAADLPTAVTLGAGAVDAIDTRASLLDQEALLKQSQDPYVTFREAYFQNLNFRVSDGKSGAPEEETLSEEELKNID
ncbi:hypothetical protein A4G20_08450 [Pasteurellaceae bacterium RH1A]|nr:hypothetical protein A4G20_08450 [Pasteurellaceae bacterium RH1A]